MSQYPNSVNPYATKPLAYAQENYSHCIASVNANGDPVDIHRWYASAPAPMGIVDYGIENESGYEVPYSVLADSIIGTAEIFSLGAHNGTQNLVNPYCASLQLNVILQINTTLGQEDYWLQDMADFTTNTNLLYFTDNIWNESSPNANNMTSSGVSGQGNVYNDTDNPGEYYYARSSKQWVRYDFPFGFNLPISILESANSVNVTFAYQILTNGQNSQTQDPINYDTATIQAPGVNNASIIINGWSNQTPSGYAYDAELVFGGEFSREKTTFTEMNATLNMHYLTSNGTIITPYALYGFGSDTGEAAYNLETIMANGTYTVVLGEPNFTESYIAVPIPFVPLSISSFNDTFGSTSLFLTNSNALLNLSIIGGFAPFNYLLMDGNILVNNITTNDRAISFSYSPSSRGDHELSIVVVDATGYSVSSRPIIESYDIDYEPIFLIVLFAAAICLIIIVNKKRE